jgi:dTDP-4-amino-4,6-dideoxygalactose transaminase
MSAWHLYPIRLELERLHASRKEIFAALRAENVGVNVHYVPVHYHTYYRKLFGYQSGAYPIAEAAYESLITLPMFHSMTAQDVEDVVNAVRKVVSYYRR